MSFRTVNSSTHTEDGWRCCNRDECDIPRIPDLFLVDTAPIRKGAPLTILGAWVFWYDRNVEEIFTPVWGWSETNDVLGQPGKNNGSNHLSGTAVDVCAPKYPWGTKTMPPDKVAKVEEGRRLFRIGDQSGIMWGRAWSKPDEMHYQMAWREGDPRNDELAQKLRDGYLGIYKAWSGTPPGPTPTSYGLPTGTRINYGAPGFPDWVYRLAHTFGIRASTYAGHQETNRQEAGFAPNPQNLNRGIDWAGPVDAMQRYADYLFSVRGSLEQVIWQNPNTGQMVGVAGGKDVTHTGYYAGNYGGHRDHVHTRQSAPIPHPGGPTPTPPPLPSPPVLSQRDKYALAVITEGQKRGISPRGIKIALATTLVETDLIMYANSNVPASLHFPHDKVGHDHDSTGLFQQRQAWGPLECTMNPTCSAGLFYEGGRGGQRGLTDFDYNNTANTPGFYAQKVQVSQFPDRYDKRFGEAEQLYNRLSGLSGDDGEDDLSADAERKIAELHEAFFGAPDFESLSPLHKPGEGKIGNLLEFIRWMDGNIHIMVEIMLVTLRYPDPQAVSLLQSVAADPDPNRDEHDRRLAKAILAEMDEPKPAPTQTQTAPAPVVVHHYEEPEPEVLPAIIQTVTAPQSAQYNMATPEAMLHSMDGLADFHEAYMKARRELISPNRNEENGST